MNAMEIEDIDDDMPFELIEHAKAATMETLPLKSRPKYVRMYKNFKEWQNGYGVTKISSNLILAYFRTLEGKKYKPTSLWAFYSMLKATLRTHENVEIGAYTAVSAYLKAKSSGYKPIKAEVVTEAGVQNFINKAEDLSWLDLKVACIFGICGALRTEEFGRITMDDIEKHGGLFLVKIVQTKTKISRSFTINGGFAQIVRKYIDLRPDRLKSSDRFFVNYQRGKCTIQFIGKNKFSAMPRRMAEYLKLPQPERYTGHSFRRTSATFLANSGADMETIMRHGGWRNESCAKGYIEDSLAYKARTGEMIRSSVLGTCTEPHSASDIVQTTKSTSDTVFSNIDALFDSRIDDAALLDVVDRASQSNVVERQYRNEATISHEKGDEQRLENYYYPEDRHSLFDYGIDDAALVDVVERASHNNLVERKPEHCNDATITRGIDIIGNDRSMNVNGGNVSASAINDNPGILTQSVNQTSSLNAILSHSFKSVHFKSMHNCSFNFYLSK